MAWHRHQAPDPVALQFVHAVLPLRLVVLLLGRDLLILDLSVPFSLLPPFFFFPPDVVDDAAIHDVWWPSVLLPDGEWGGINWGSCILFASWRKFWRWHWLRLWLAESGLLFSRGLWLRLRLWLDEEELSSERECKACFNVWFDIWWCCMLRCSLWLKYWVRPVWLNLSRHAQGVIACSLLGLEESVS